MSKNVTDRNTAGIIDPGSHFDNKFSCLTGFNVQYIYDIGQFEKTGNTVREMDAKLDSPDTDSDILRFFLSPLASKFE
jgi:hypothetical protein